MRNFKNLALIAIALSFSLSLFHIGYCDDYYTGLGTSNLEVGIYEPYNVMQNKTYQIYVARLDNTGNVNITLPILISGTFTSGNTTIPLPNSIKINFIGKKEYSHSPVAYPFFLLPKDQVQVWLNVTLQEVGNYSLHFETDTQIQTPPNYSGPLSVINGKFNAKLTCIGKPSPSPTFSLIIDPTIVGMGIGGTILVIIIIIAIRHRRKLEQKKQQPLKGEPTEEQKKLEDMVPEFYKQEKPQ